MKTYTKYSANMILIAKMAKISIYTQSRINISNCFNTKYRLSASFKFLSCASIHVNVRVVAYSLARSMSFWCINPISC